MARMRNNNFQKKEKLQIFKHILEAFKNLETSLNIIKFFMLQNFKSDRSFMKNSRSSSKFV